MRDISILLIPMFIYLKPLNLSTYTINQRCKLWKNYGEGEAIVVIYVRVGIYMWESKANDYYGIKHLITLHRHRNIF